MHISLEEAISLLDEWRKTGIVLRVHFSPTGGHQDLQAIVRELRATVVALYAGAERLDVDLQGASFNGDSRAPAYLVCEFRNGDRCSFYPSVVNRKSLTTAPVKEARHDDR